MPRTAPYLQRRGFGLSFRISIPLDLRPVLKKSEITKALPTANKRQAVPMALEYAAYAKRMFFQLREAIAALNDNEVRGQAMDFDKLEKLIREKKFEIKLEDLQIQHEDELVSKDRQHKVELKQARLEAENETMRRILASSHTLSTATPSLTPVIAITTTKIPLVTIAKSKKHRLSDAIPQWELFNKPTATSVRGFKFAISRFEKLYPDLYVEDTEKSHVTGFIQHMLNDGKSSKTIEKEHGMIRTIFTFGIDQGWIGFNPAKGVKLPKSVKSPVRGYTIEEVKLIIHSPIFASGWRPNITKASKGWGEAVYWVPLLLLFTGARLDEICQLTTDRISVIDGVNVILIDTIDEEASLKTEGSKRTVPIHNSLVRLGLLEYVINIGEGMLFPILDKNEDGNYGASIGRWWGKYLRSTVKITDKNISPSHSFRHLFITECRRLDFRDDFDYAITGHTKSRADSHGDYGTYPIEALFKNINKIDFKGLDFSHMPKQ